MTLMNVRPTTEDDWELVRELRMRALADTPKAYLETLEEAYHHDEAEWRMRAARGVNDHGTSLIAEDEHGRWLGGMGGFVPDEAVGPLLVGVFVDPSARGRGAGVADALLDGIEAWARTRGDALTLHVHEENPRAIAFYERRGFVADGVRIPYPLAEGEWELQMVKRLRD
ncbi:GNAT family N-acetyltransferase [Galactobacter valiniphilus]|uniref:GNAT family N-acetyltransferase n=1 Tax=Galactobacter valiniphilus TaxID=2676122 RepID=A0A399JA51_9MICC|nr:GNAT family N-acetyltransferase [Galactobacter valiniphilus]RII42418.1 GNAT family N-acetyltransferase [Galactobacter valiniphilus]